MPRTVSLVLAPLFVVASLGLAGPAQADVKDLRATSTALSTSRTSQVYGAGSTATLTATVDATSPAPQGTVKFAVDGKHAGTATVKESKASFKLGPGTAPGSRSFTATFVPAKTSIAKGSNSPKRAVKVVKAKSKTAMKLNKNKQVKGKKSSRIRLSTRVSTNNGTAPRGRVLFKSSRKVIAKAPVRKGKASARVPARTKTGKRKVTAVFIPSNRGGYKASRSAKKRFNVVVAKSDKVWDRLAKCESGGNWHANSGNGYYGGLQFSKGTWKSVGGKGFPHKHDREEQIKRGKKLQKRSGWSQWPVCSRKIGKR